MRMRTHSASSSSRLSATELSPDFTETYHLGMQTNFLEICTVREQEISGKCQIHGFPRLFSVISAQSVFYCSFFSVFALFSCRLRAVN